jgi:Fe-S-cluster containining protein
MSFSIKNINDLIKLEKIKTKNFENSIKDIIKKKNLKIDCHSGCSTCCKSIRVELLQSEAFSIYHYIINNFEEEKINKLKKIIKDNYEKTKGNTLNEHLNKNLDCPLLVNNKCSIYDYRPMMCMQYASPDYKMCVTTNCSFTPYEKELQLPLLFGTGYPGLKYTKTLAANGIKDNPCEINEALYKLFRGDVSFENLKNGEILFNKLKI